MPIPAKLKFTLLIILLFSFSLSIVSPIYSQEYTPVSNNSDTTPQDKDYETKLTQAEPDIIPIIPIIILAPFVYGFGRKLAQAGMKKLKDVATTTSLSFFSDTVENFFVDLASKTLGEDYACNIIPYDKEKCKEYVNPDYYEKVPEAAYTQTGFLAASTNAVAAAYSPAIKDSMSTMAYVRYTLGDNLLSSPAYAQQKSGRATLQPVLYWWSRFRNIVYGLYLIIFVLIGFMLMFRVKLDPRTTISVVNALPGIVVSLILVTFSFPIAGLIIDFGFVIKGIVDTIFATKAYPFTGMPGWNINAYEALRTALTMMPPILGIGGGALIMTLIIWVIMAFLIIGVFIRVFVILLTRWAAIFVRVITAPLVLFLSALPGQSGRRGEWFKKITTDVMVFPAIYFLIRLGLAVGSWTAPQIEMPYGLGFIPILTEKSQGLTFIQGIVGFGIITGATKVPELIESALDIVPSPHTARAGMDVTSAFKKIPFLGGMFK